MNELKRELSKLSGVDFFNPKYRDVFKKYFTEKEDAKDEVKDEDVPVMDTEEVKSEAEPVKEEAVEEEKVEESVEEKVEDVEKAEEETEEVVDKVEEEAEAPEVADEKAEEVPEESHEIDDVDEVEDGMSKDEQLLDAKIELELMKSGVKPEKIEVAKKYTKHEVLSLDELEKIKGIIAEFPDWVRAYKAEDIGMPVDEDGDALTEEEKKLKAMGIDPR